MTEAEVRHLLACVSDRDERAFSMLYREFASRVGRFLEFRVNAANRALVEDVVCDTFFAVWTAPHRFDGSSTFTTWLLSIASKQLLYKLRSERRWSVHENLDDLPEPCDELADPFEQLSRKQSAEVLVRCAERLNPDQRASLYLMHVEGMSQSEVALVMGIPVNTVKSRVRLAISRVLPCVQRALTR